MGGVYLKINAIHFKKVVQIESFPQMCFIH